MSVLTQRKPGSTFDRALATVDALAVDEQEALLDVVRKRIAAARREQCGPERYGPSEHGPGQPT